MPRCYNFSINWDRKRPKIDVIPSIDIRDGKCVRLYQGDYHQETVFSDDPLDVALKWQSMGAPRLHLVDLDGAATGEIGNLEIITNIARAMLIPVQLGGGIRNMETIETLLKIGLDRVVIGTAAVENPQLVTEACRRYQESVVVAIDARNGMVATRGWVQDTGMTAITLAQTMARKGVSRFIYTDIERDGTLTEPNFTAISGLVDEIGLPIIAAGGIATIDHLTVLQKIGVEGAIIGKALYTEDIDLKEAIETLNR